MGLRKKKLDFYKKLIVSCAVTTVAVAGLAGQAPVSADVVFNDVSSDHYAKEAINELVAKGIVKGFPDGTFRPQQELLREHAAALLVRSLELQSSTTNEQYFKDVPKTSSYFGAVSALREAGIFLGDHQGNFHPKTSLTREEMATILVRAFNLKAQAGVDVKLTDLDQVSASHKENVKILYQNGITIGYGDGSFRPKKAVNRADFAVFISRGLTLGTKGKTIEAITDNGVTIEGMTYTLSSSLQDLFTSNKDSLVGSKIHFQTSNKQITGITYLELAKASTVFDGKGFSLTGNLKVAAPNVTVKNITVTGNLEVSDKATGTVLFDQVGVNGATALTSVAVQSTATTTANSVSFNNSTLTNVLVDHKGVAVNFQGSTIVKSLEIQTDTTVKADQSVVLPSVTVAERAQHVTLEATMTDLSLKNRRDLHLKTVGNINQLKLESLHPVTLDLNGKIQTLAPIKNSALTLNVATGSTVAELKLPEGVQAKDVIKNYEQVKHAFGAQPGGSFAPGPSFPSPNPDPTPPVVEWDSAENPFANNVVYASNYLITAVNNANYGADTAGSEAIIEGNVVIKGDINEQITLKNLVIKGKLVLDVGDQSSVTLQNVKADQIEILSGKKGTIHLNGVQSKIIIVKDDNGVRLSTNGVNVIDRIEVDPTNSSAISDIELAGNFNHAKIIVKNETRITAKEGFSAQAIEIETKNANSEVTFVSSTGSFADVQEVTLKKAATLNSSGNTQIKNIVLAIPQSEQNNTVTLKGEHLSETEITVKTPSTLNVNAVVGKILAEANVKIGGENVAEIQAFEKTSNAIVTAANESVQNIFDTIKQQKVDVAIAEIKKLPELSAVAFADIASVQSARKNVNTAISFGATNADFVVEDVDYLEQLTKIEASIAVRMSAITEVQQAIRALPTNPGNVQAIALEGLQTRVTAVNKAIAAAKDAGVSQADIEKLKDYARVEDANVRVEELVAERNSARELATTKLSEIPAAAEITFSNLLEVQQLLVDVKKAIAEAEDKGVTIEGLASLTAAEAKVKQLFAERDEAIRVATEKIELIPAEITYNNLEASRRLVEEAAAAVEAAKAKTAADHDITNITKLTSAMTRIAQLDEGTRQAITVVDEAIRALPAVTEITYLNLEEMNELAETVRALIAAAKEKGANDASFENLAKLVAFEAKVKEMLETRAAAIAVANTAIDAIPSVEAITTGNVEEVQELIATAREKVAAAKELGAIQADFPNYAKIAEAQVKVDLLLATLEEAIEYANELIRLVPLVADITFATLVEAKEKTAAARVAVTIAKELGATDSSFENLTRLKNAELKIAELKKEKNDARNEAIEAANVAIANILPASEITVENFRNEFEKVKQAEVLIAEARAKGATDNDFVGIEKLAQTQEAIANFFDELYSYVVLVDLLIAELPAVTEINYANLIEVKERVDFLEGAIERAFATGAYESDFEDLAKFTAVQTKVTQLVEEKSTAIKIANEKIALVPIQSLITPQNLADTKTKLAAAQQAVTDARAKGAEDKDFIGISKLALAESKIREIEAAQVVALANANEALANLPLASEVNEENVQEVRLKVNLARNLVKAARDLGVQDNQFVGLDNLNALLERLEEFGSFLEEALARTNELLVELRDFGVVNGDNAAQAQVVYLTAYLAVTEALNLGAKISDFDKKGYDRYLALEAELEAFKPERPRQMDPISSLAEIVRNPEGFDYYYLQTAVSVRVEPALLEDYRQEIIEFLKNDEKLTLAILKGLVENVHERKETNGQAVIDQINNDVTKLTYSLLTTLVWTDEENFETVREKLAAAKALKSLLTRNEIISIVQNATHAYALEQVLTNPEFTYSHLRWAVIYHQHLSLFTSYIESYRHAIRSALENGPLTPLKLAQVIVGVNEAIEKETLAKINRNLPSVTPADFEPLVYVNNWMYPLFLDALVKFKVEVQRDLTREDLNQLYNTLSRKSALDALNNNPEIIDYYALQQLGITQLVLERFAEYRTALIEARKDGVLTIEEIQSVIITVNGQSVASAIERINNNRSTFSFTDLQEVVSWAKLANLARYREEMTARFSYMTLTLALIEEVVNSVDRSVALHKINLTPNNVSFELLRDALAFMVRDGNYSYYFYYRNATVREELLSYYQEAIHQAAKPFTIDTLADLVLETNHTIQAKMLDQINSKPAEVTAQMLQLAGIHSISYEYLYFYRLALVEAVDASNIPLTRQQIQDVIWSVNEAQALDRINANPLTFSMSDLFSVISVHAEQGLLSYYQQEINQRRTQKGANLTKQEVEAAVNAVNNNIRAIALQIVNDETQTVSFEWLNRAAYNVRSQFMSQYRQALLQRKSSLGWLTEQAVQEVITSVNSTEMAKYINANVHFTYDDLWDVVQGYNIRRNMFQVYHEAITSHEQYGSLTVEQIITIVQTVNDQSTLVQINNYPELLTIHELRQLLNWLPIIREQNFEAYKAAIVDRIRNQEAPFVTVKELENLVISINQNLLIEALAEINSNPSGFSFEALTKLEIYVELIEENLVYYRQVITEKRNHKGADLTLHEIQDAIVEANQLALEAMELKLEVETYEDMATVAIGDVGDITGLVLKLRESMTVNETIMLQVHDEQFEHEYLYVNETNNAVFLSSAAKELPHSLTEKLLVTFTKGNQTVSKEITVTINVEDQAHELEVYIKSLVREVEELFNINGELHPGITLEIVKTYMKEVDAFIATFPELVETDKLLDRAYEILILATTK